MVPFAALDAGMVLPAFVAAQNGAPVRSFRDTTWWLVLVLSVGWAIRISALFVVPRNRKPSSALAWLMAIFLFPVPGAILFLIIGNRNLPRARTARLEAVNTAVAQLAEQEAMDHRIVNLNEIPDLAGAITLAQSLGAQPMLTGNAGEVCIDYEQSLANMAEAIDSAQTYVHLEFYALQHDKSTDVVFQAMKRAKERGVEIRVLLDHITSVTNKFYKETKKSLDKVTTAWTYMLPVRPFRGQYQRPDLRNHRKLLIVDGRVGFMGSQNMVDSSYNKKSNIKRGLQWRDIMVRLHGPVVLGLEVIFQGDWYMETGENISFLVTEAAPTLERPGDLSCQIVPSGPGYEDENNLQLFIALLYTAKKRISITSPYFVPDAAIMNALRAATARGVDVELFVSETGDQAMVYHAQRSYYEELLRAGVRIQMFKPPYILHSKHFTIDDHVVVIGSSNMDERSFNLNMEVSMMVVGRSFVEQIDEATAYYLENSREMSMEEWSRQPWHSRLLDNIARLTSALQ